MLCIVVHYCVLHFPELPAYNCALQVGPDTRTMQRRAIKSLDVPLVMGVDPHIVTCILELLKSYGLDTAPCMLVEDGTAAQCHLNVFKDAKCDVGWNGATKKVCWFML